MTSKLMINKANNATARVPKVKKPRSIFPVNFYRKQTMMCSYLTPIFFEEVLPSDTWIIRMQSFARLATQIAPPMDNLWFKTYWFYVPYRQVWDNFPKQHGERENPDDNIDYTTPKIDWVSKPDFNSIYDYFEVPPDIANQEISALPFRAYNRIYNQFFRSERLQNSVYENHTDSDDLSNKFELLKIGKMHDYFTDCLPDLQLGEQVTLPLGQSAPVYGIDEKGTPYNSSLKVTFATNNDNPGTAGPDSLAFALTNKASGGVGQGIYMVDDENTEVALNGKINVINKWRAKTYDLNSGLYADLSDAVSATITAMRNAIDLQTILERDNRNGTRYTEMLEGRYGAVNPDLRLQRPQFLGSTATPLTTTAVVQTSGSSITGSDTPQGNLAGYGATGDKGNVVKASFGEFGCIIGLAVLQVVPQYQQGLQRKLTRFERFDYYYPEFAGMSDQAVLNKEIYSQGTSDDDKVFGYIGRYDEYRYFNNHICGELRSTYPQSLDVWHYAEKFENLPALNANFIEDKADDIVTRSLAVKYEDVEQEIKAPQIIAGFNFEGTVTRVMPSKPIPQTGGRIL